VSKAHKVSVVDKVSYHNALVKVKSQRGFLHRTLGGATGVQPPVTSTPVVVPPPAPRMPATDAPPARHELFQATDNAEQAETCTAADQTERVEQGRLESYLNTKGPTSVVGDFNCPDMD